MAEMDNEDLPDEALDYASTAGENVAGDSGVLSTEAAEDDVTGMLGLSAMRVLVFPTLVFVS